MKPSLILSLAFWFSVLAETWILVLRLIPFDALSVAAWLFFFVVAIGASAVAAPQAVNNSKITEHE